MAKYRSLRSTSLLCSTILSVVIPSAASAQETKRYVTLDPIVIQARDPDSGTADRATAVYVADAEIERAAMGDLKDLFAGIASVSVGGAIPVAQKIFVNGVDMLNLAIQVDGVSQNNRVFHHVSANAFDPGLMKSVRVDPGAAPADAGPRALAGRVVMKTVDAADVLEDGKNFGGRARLSYDGNGKTAQGSLTLAGKHDGFEVLAYAKRATGDDYKDGDGVTMTGTGANLKAHLFKLAYESDRGDRIEFVAQDMADAEWRNAKANFGPSGRKLQFYDTYRSIVSLSYENTQADGMWDPFFSVGRSKADIAKLTPGDDARGVSKTTSLVLKNRFHLSGATTITAGIDHEKRESTVTGEYWNIKNNLANSGTEESTFTGIFAQARMEPAENLKVSAGFRYDWVNFKGHDVGMSGKRYERSDTGFSGNVSVVYNVNDALALRAAYSDVFGGVDLGDNFEFYQPYNYAGLKTSRARNLVLGADWTGANWTLGAELFRTDIKNARDISRKGDVILKDFRSQGVNLAATYNWTQGFARMSYSYSKATVNGKPASSYDLGDLGAPLGNVFALEVQHELPRYDMLIGGSIEAATSLNAGGSYADKKIPGYKVVNVFAEYAPPALNGVAIRGSINNLFNETYADRATYGGEFAGGFKTLNEPGRNVSLVVTSKF